MPVTVTDDKGQEIRLEGDWTGRLVGQDFTNGGQIMVWLRPGANGWAEPVVAPPELDRVEAIAAIASGRQDVPPPPKGN